MQSVDINRLLEIAQAFDLHEYHDRILDRQRDSRLGLVVMVVGEGNFGKSSLVNAVCGKEVAPVAVVPKTFKIDVHLVADQEEAFIRYPGSEKVEAVSHQEARKRSEEAELAARQGERVDIAEIVWHHKDISLPKGIAIVDTPGISQALGGSAKSRTLTRVLGSTFEVDEVWAHWFHRADIVLWGFSSNKMQSAETRQALEDSLNLFEKHVIPVATKADLISNDRWSQIHEHFDHIYSPLLSRHRSDRLHVTVCGGKSRFVGFGVDELRGRLIELQKDKLEVKRRADLQFAHDVSSSISKVLQTTASELVANLRTIASLGDELAGEAVKLADRAEREACASIGSYFGSLRQSPTISEIAERIHSETHGGRTGDIELICLKELEGFVNMDRIRMIVNDTFTQAGSSLEYLSRRLAAGSSISRITFKSNGKILKTSLDLNLSLEVQLREVRSNFSVKFQSPQGLLERFIDFLGSLFGFEKVSVKDIEKVLSNALVIDYEQIKELRQRVLLGEFVPGIQDAIFNAIAFHLKEADHAAIEKLKLVDAFLPEIAMAEGATVHTFGAQSEYWSSVHPGVDTLLNLAKVELTRLLPEFRLAMKCNVELPIVSGSVPARKLWEGRKVKRIEPADQVLNVLPFVPSEVSVSVGLRELVAGAYTIVPINSSKKASFEKIDYSESVIKCYRASLERHAIVVNLDRRLTDSTVGVRYSNAGDKLVEHGVRALTMAMNKSQRQWEWRYSVRQILGVLFPPSSHIIGSVLLGAGLLGLFVHVSVSFTLAVLSVSWFLGCSLLPAKRFFADYERSVSRIVAEEINMCISESSIFLPDECVGEILSGMTAELAPRPLQKLLLAARGV